MSNAPEPVPLPERWVSIDPGDLHVGIAWWVGETCVLVKECNPETAILDIEEAFRYNALDLVACEKFALDGRRALQQGGSEFLTSQLIGVIKYLCDRNEVPYVGYFNHQHKRIYKMSWYQALDLKSKRKLPWWGRGTGEHCKDSWCVGMWLKHERGHGQYDV